MTILERFEGNIAVIEVDGKLINISSSLVDKGVHEGDLLKKVDGIYYADKGKTKARREEIAELQDSLFE